MSEEHGNTRRMSANDLLTACSLDFGLHSFEAIYERLWELSQTNETFQKEMTNLANRVPPEIIDWALTEENLSTVTIS